MIDLKEKTKIIKFTLAVITIATAFCVLTPITAQKNNSRKTDDLEKIEKIKIIPGGLTQTDAGWQNNQAIFSQDLSDLSSLQEFNQQNSTYFIDPEPITDPAPITQDADATAANENKDLKVPDTPPQTEIPAAENKNPGKELPATDAAITPAPSQPEDNAQETGVILNVIADGDQSADNPIQDVQIIPPAPELDNATTTATDNLQETAINPAAELPLPAKPTQSEKTETPLPLKTATTQPPYEKSLELSKFNVDESLLNAAIDNLQLRFSFAATAPKNEIAAANELAVEYSLDGSSWQESAVLELNRDISNQTDEGYFLSSLPKISRFNELANLKLRITFRAKSPGTGQIAYLDTLWIEADYQKPLSLQELTELMQKKIVAKFYRQDQNPEFIFSDLENKNNFFQKILKWFRGQKTEVAAKLINPFGEETTNNITIDGTKVTIANVNKNQFRPGRYTIEITIKEGDTITQEQQTFDWGVLTVNFDKSIYKIGNTAQIDFGVLNHYGHTICNANLVLEITGPDGKKDYPKVIPSNDCSEDNITDKPDYSTTYPLSKSGNYHINVIAQAEGIIQEITDSFQVAETVKFDVKRIGPTRINPRADYKMSFQITPNQDYYGKIDEYVPSNFEIKETFGIGNDRDIEIIDNVNKLEWQADMEAGKTYEYAYTFKAPMLSPYIFLLGPLQIGDFAEIRQWQIASDAAAETCNSTGSGNWSTAGTWSCGHAPGTNGVTSDVYVLNSHTVTIDADTNTSYVNTITINNGGVLTTDNNSRVITIADSAGGTAFTNNGTFTAGNSTVIIKADASITVFGGSLTGSNKFNDLTFSPAQTGNRTYTGGAAIAVGGNFNITPSGSTSTRVFTYNLGGYNNITGDLVINHGSTATATVSTTSSDHPLSAATITLSASGNTFNARGSQINLTGTSGTLLTNSSGTFTYGTSDVRITSTSGPVTLLSSTTTFCGLTINAPGITVNAGAAITINSYGRLYIQSGTLDDGGNQITGVADGTMEITSTGTLKLGSAATATTFPTNFTNANITLSSFADIIYQAGVAQTISGVPTYGDLIITPLANTPSFTIDAATTINGNLTINGGYLQTSSYQITGIATKRLTMASGAYLCVSGSGTACDTSSTTAVTLPSGFSFYTLDATSTVIYKGDVAMAIARTSYGNLILSPTITAARIYTFDSGNISINGDFTIQPETSAYLLTVNMGGNITMPADKTVTITRTTSSTSKLDTTASNYSLTAGHINIATGGTLTANASSITLNGTDATALFTRVGTFTQGTSEVIVAPAAASTPTLLSGTATFHRLTINPNTSQGAYTINTGAAITMSNANAANRLYIKTGALNDGGAQITGTTNGTLVMDASTYLMLGSAGTATTFPSNYTNANIALNVNSAVAYQAGVAQTVSGVPTYGTLEINPTANTPSFTLSTNTTVNGNLTIYGGYLQTSSYQITGNSNGNFSISSGAYLCLSGSGTSCGTSSTSAVTFPTNFTADHLSLDINSTVIYKGNVNMAISAVPAYGNLIMSPTITAARIYNFNSGAITINGNFTIQPGTANYLLTVNMAGNITLPADKTVTITRTTSSTSKLDTTANNYNLTAGFLNIANGGTLTANASTITLNGTSSTLFTRVGTFTQGTSEVIITSYIDVSATLLSDATTFHRLTINLTAGGTGLLYAGGAITISNADANNRLYIQAGILDDGGYQITGTANGTMVINSNCFLRLGSAATATTFPANYTTNFTADPASNVTYQSNVAQAVAAVNYGNLNIEGTHTTTDVTLASSGTISIAGAFSPAATFTSGQYIKTGSTIDYNGTGAQTIVPFDYNNLTISGAHTTNSITLSSSNPINIASNCSATATFTSGGYINTGSTINYNGTGAQTVCAINYNNLTLSGTHTTNSITLASSGTTGIAGTFNPSATFTSGTYVVTGSTIEYNGTGTQSIIAFTYNNLNIKPTANSVTDTFAAGTVTVQGTLIVGNGTNTGTVATAATNDPDITVNGGLTVNSGATLTSTDNTSKTLNVDGKLTINGTFTAPSGTAATSFTLGGDFENNGTYSNNSGRITFDDNGGANDQTLSGSTTTTTFYQLYIAAGGTRTLYFTDAKHYAVDNAGTLSLQGTASYTLNLRRTSTSDYWYLDIGSGTTVDIDYVDVSYSNATGSGKLIDARGNGNTEVSDHNINWYFNDYTPIFTVGSEPHETPTSDASTPTNIGSDVTIKATATDGNNEQYYLAICKTNAIIANNNAAPTCTGGNWGISSAIDSGSEATITYTTQTSDTAQNYAWYAFACDKNTVNPTCSSMSNIGTSGNNGSPFSVNHRPTFTTVTNDGPKNPGASDLTITASSYNDTDTDGAQDTVSMYVCKAADFTGTACSTGGTWCSVTGVTPTATLACDLTIPNPQAHGTVNYYAYIIDSHNFAANGGQQGAANTFTVSDVAPAISGTPTLNNAGAMTLTAEKSTTDIYVRGIVTDDNGCADIDVNNIKTDAWMTNLTTRTGCDSAGEADSNKCYYHSNCTYDATIDTCGTSDKTGGYKCTISFQYYANPTDTNTPWASDSWTATLIPGDGQGENSNGATNTNTQEMNSFLAMNLATGYDSISYGTVSANGTTDPLLEKTRIEASGNCALNTNLSGTTMTGPGTAIPIANQRYGIGATAPAWSAGTALSGTPAGVNVGICKTGYDNDSNIPARKPIWWGINIPSQQISGAYTGTNTIEAVKRPWATAGDWCE